MMNMGGPRNSEEVNGFLNNLFADRDIIRLPWQVTKFFVDFYAIKKFGSRAVDGKRFLESNASSIPGTHFRLG